MFEGGVEEDVLVVLDCMRNDLLWKYTHHRGFVYLQLLRREEMPGYLATGEFPDLLIPELYLLKKPGGSKLHLENNMR